MSVLAKADRLTTVRAGFWRRGDVYVPAKLLSAVEPPVAGASLCRGGTCLPKTHATQNAAGLRHAACA